MGKPDEIRKISELEELTAKIEELEAQNRDLMGMIENSYDALAIIDGEGRLLHLNPAFERVMGLKNAEILGRKTGDLVSEGVTDNAASVRVIETGKQQTVIINTNAGRQVLSTGIPVFGPDGKIFRIYCNLRDITDLNLLHEKFEQSQRLVSKYLIELHEVKKQQTLQSEFIAHNQRMRHLIETAYRIARVDATVLILGESGVGKEMFARIIHDASPRAEAGIFVKINCGAIPGELLESELFGYEGGAFTGASKEGKAGYFEIADKGTLLLDEIGELPLNLQVKLLTVLQDQEITRVGGIRTKKIDVRILAATNQDLDRMVKEGRFRQDLFYRLNVVPFSVPPLRDRRDDIPFLLIHYLGKYNKKYGRNVRFDKETFEALLACPWPGNVRELSNLVEQLVVVTDESVIKPEHLPGRYISETGFGSNERMTSGAVISLKKELRRHEERIIKRALSEYSTLEETALRLGVSLSTLTRRLRSIKTDGQN